MKKILSILIISSLIIGGLGATAYQKRDTPTIESFSTNIHVDSSQLSIKSDQQKYIQVSFNEQDGYLLNPGKPILPKIVKTFELPFGVTNIQVKTTPQHISTRQVEKQIQPSPSPLPLSPNYAELSIVRKDAQLYQSSQLYPSTPCIHDVGVGLNEDLEHVTFVTVHLYPVQYIPAENTLHITEQADIEISYTMPESTPFQETTAAYDMVLITPSEFSDALQPLIEHKNSYGIETFLKTTEEIYNEYGGVDEAEQIKYFIKDAIETLNIHYVLLVGGLKSTFYAKPKDNTNLGSSGWHIPVRYSNMKAMGDLGYPADYYYADIYKEGGEFEDWDYDGDGIFAEWPDDERPPEDTADLRPDVAVGRLASSDAQEITEIVNKIITYETTTYGQDWFNKIITFSGDGFLDQFDLNIQWDTKEIPDGTYIINAQSNNPEGTIGPIDSITVTIDKTVASNITFNHDDHLNPALEQGYPAPPIAEIVSVSNGNTLGNTDVEFEPSEYYAYCNTLYWWANISYIDEVLTIRGKTYDPKPYGNLTDIHVWVENSQGEVVFSEWRTDMPTYYEGEWVTGERAVHGRGGGFYYMPESFESEIIWTSNGQFTGPQSIIDSFNEGHGFAFFSGHGSPGYWGDHNPGVPGNRQYGSVDGLLVSNLYTRPPFIFDQPVWPMDTLTNTHKLPVTVVGGCHNSLFNVSLIPSSMHYFLLLLGKDTGLWTYGQVIPQCWSWYLVQLPDTGSIATIGNTGLSWGWEGEFCTVGSGDGWLSSEFFRQYGEHYPDEPYQILGNVYLQTQTAYVNHFKDFTLPESWWFPDIGWDAIDQQAIEQWVLLGDPSLRIGGYP